MHLLPAISTQHLQLWPFVFYAPIALPSLPELAPIENRIGEQNRRVSCTQVLACMYASRPSSISSESDILTSSWPNSAAMTLAGRRLGAGSADGASECALPGARYFWLSRISSRYPYLLVFAAVSYQEQRHGRICVCISRVNTFTGSRGCGVCLSVLAICRKISQYLVITLQTRTMYLSRKCQRPYPIPCALLVSAGRQSPAASQQVALFEHPMKA